MSGVSRVSRQKLTPRRPNSTLANDRARNGPLTTDHGQMHDQSSNPFSSPSGHSGKADPATLPDLPKVEPPSAGFVIQLFVIPAVVVVVVIIVWLLFGKLAGGKHNAMEYVHRLRSPTATWRYAFELASLIQHDPKVGSDPVVLGELTDLLSHELDNHQEDPKLTQYVALTLGAFKTLEARTESGQTVNPLDPLAQEHRSQV